MLLLTLPFGVISCQQKISHVNTIYSEKVETVLRFLFYKSKWLWARV